MLFSQWVRNLLFPLVCVFVILSSCFLSRTPSLPLLLAAGGLLIISVLFEKRLRLSGLLQPLLLGFFHWCSHLNWSQTLYFLLLLLWFTEGPPIKKLFLNAFFLGLLYTAVRLTYLPLNAYNSLVSIYDLLTFILIVWCMRYMYTAQKEKNALLSKNDYLSTHDPLTGLLNFDTYTKKMDELVLNGTDFVLLLLDFRDFKSVNNISIRNGNEVLSSIAKMLKSQFYDANAVARYAGDRFALVIPQEDYIAEETAAILDPRNIGYEVSYSTARYPQEGGDTQMIIALAEDRLFQEKRKLWLKQEEELFRTEKLMAVGELAAGMAHEIRNPLTAMQGFMQLSRYHAYNIEPYFDTMMHEITRMNELTAEFLQFSKPHIGNMKPESVSLCLERVRMLTESQALARGHRLIVQTPDTPVMVLIERDKMTQVLLNIIRNAMEAMDDPGQILVQLIPSDTEAEIEIRDTGPGIPEEALTKIFNPFYTTKESGTGLGLSICYKIVRDHGGSISVQSVVGRGTAFYIKLPLYRKNEAQLAERV